MNLLIENLMNLQIAIRLAIYFQTSLIREISRAKKIELQQSFTVLGLLLKETLCKN